VRDHLNRVLSHWQEVPRKINEMVKTYISKPSCIILAVTPHTQVPNLEPQILNSKPNSSNSTT